MHQFILLIENFLETTKAHLDCYNIELGVANLVWVKFF